MNILAMNVGSSSIKYCVFQNKKKLINENIERIGETKGRFKTRAEATKYIHDKITENKIKVDVIGHRVVHGGDLKTARINKKIMAEIEKRKIFAPLHQQAEIDVIKACERYFSLPQYAVFDTAFYVDLPKKSKIYALPYSYFEDGIKRYGFHGLSHSFIASKTKGKVISCHLGSGCSITAIKNGRPVDTSMGFTPLEGLIMGTRSGDIDPSIIFYLMTKKGFGPEKIDIILNKESGLKGISGISNDMRDLLKSKNSRAKLAVDAYVYRIAKYIGAYSASMNGVDTVVFTAGTGYRNSNIRKRIINYLGYLGADIDSAKNKKNALVISSKKSKVKIMVIETDEEQTIADEVIRYSHKTRR